MHVNVDLIASLFFLCCDCVAWECVLVVCCLPLVVECLWFDAWCLFARCASCVVRCVL